MNMGRQAESGVIDGCRQERLRARRVERTLIPDITYLVLNYNPSGEDTACRVLEENLRAFYERKSPRLRGDVYLLDQGSPEGHRRRLLELQTRYGLSAILLNRNIGISRAVNFLVRTAKSPVFALITSDVIVTSGMDEDLFQKVQIPEVYQATPFTDKSDVDHQIWKPQAPYGTDHPDLTELQEKETTLKDKLFRRRRRGYLRYVGVEFNVMFWRREIFAAIGYFDERWKAAYENNDFSLRCFLAGGCTALSVDSFVWHYHKVTEKNASREQAYPHCRQDWRGEMRRIWDEKWPELDRYFNIYKPLGEKTIRDFPAFHERFKGNIFLPYDQKIEYF
ncbi:MAG TPA: glycosyltransferase [Syntrophales bacterium]|nr:glycosyltransferase [Syntrophales bacterium]HQK79033.1 glycosyltransferase [Syntrophales bacterium]